jgi:cob(I)alamin adenosyltransferase
MSAPGFKQGLVIIHTGDGKGKTTAALGLAFRAAGHGLRSLVIQFIKSSTRTGEFRLAQQMSDLIDLRAMGTGFVIGEWSEADTAAAREAWQVGSEAILSGSVPLVILDEITYPLNAGALSEAQVVQVLGSRPAHVTVVLTGRGASDALIAAADLVTRMECVKHPYEQGIKAQGGIEY